MNKLLLFLRRNDPVVRLSKCSHCPGNEYSLARHLVKYISSETVPLTNTIVFPGCGSGAYELAFLLELQSKHRFSKVIMMDNKLDVQDSTIWQQYMPTSEVIVLDSFHSLTTFLKNNQIDINVIFFHKAKHIEQDPWYAPFRNACKQRCSNPYIHAFNNGENRIYSNEW